MQNMQQTPLASQKQPVVRDDKMKNAAIIMFVIGFCFHLFGFIPVIGLIFSLIAFACYIIAFVCLCLI